MDQSETLGVLLAVAQPLVRVGLCTVLTEAPELRLVGEATSGTDVLRLCRAVRPAVVLLDARLADPSAPDTVAALRRDCPATRVLALAPPGAIAVVRALVVLGAAGAVALDETPDIVLAALRAIGRGGTWYRPADPRRADAGTPARHPHADPTGARGAGAPGRWATQRRDRGGAEHRGADGRIPRRPSARQTGGTLADGGTAPRAGARAAGERRHSRHRRVT